MTKRMLLLVLAGCVALFAAGPAHATLLYWDTDGSSANGIQPGSGTWDNSTTPGWSDTVLGSSPLKLWTSSADDASFYANSTPTSAISVGAGGVGANSIQFTGTGYTLAGTGTVTLGAGGIVANKDGIINSTLTGTSGLTLSGTGTVVLGGTNTYSGTTTISSGTLRVGGVPVGAAGYYSFDTVAGTTVTNEGTLGTAYNGTLSGGAVVTGGGGGAKGEAMSTPSGTSMMLITPVGGKGIDLAGGNWTASAWFNGLAPQGAWRTLFRGTPNDHQVIVQDSSQLLGVYDGAGGGGFRTSGYSMATGGVTTGWHQVTAVGTGTTTTLYIDGVQAGTAADRKSVLDIYAVGNYQSGGQRFADKVDEVYVYQRALSAGEAQGLYDASRLAAPPAPIPATSPVVIASAGTLVVNSTALTIGGLSGAGKVTLGTSGLTVNSTAPSTFSGSISGTGSLTATGGGTLTLSGSNTYSGQTIINGGTLKLAAPTAPVDGSALWLDATNSGSMTVDGSGNVSEWRSLVGTDKVVQATATRQPNLVAGQINGNAAVAFTASTQDLLTTSTNFAAPVTVLFVGRETGGSNQRLVSSVSNNWLLGFHGGGYDKAYFEGWVYNPSNSADTLPRLYTGLIRGAGQNSEIYSNGTLLVANQSGVTGPNGLALGGWGSGAGSEYSNGQVGELLVYKSALSSADRQTLENYLRVKWLGLPAINILPVDTAVSITGGGTLDLNGIFQTVGSLSGDASASVLLGGATLTVGDTTSTTYAGAISGAGNVTKVGTGKLTLSGTNTYGGSTTINAGVLQFNSAASVGGSGQSVLINGGGIAAAGWVGGLQSGLLARINSASTGTLALTASTSESLDFAAANVPSAYLGAIGSVTYTGTLTPFGTTYRLGGGGGTLTLSNTNALTGGRDLVIGGAGGGTVALTASNNYTNGTTLNACVLNVGSYSSLGSGGLTFNGGTLQFATGSAFDISTRTVTMAAGGGTIDTNGNNVTFANPIGNGGTGALTKTGTGILTLGAVETYTGATNINAGQVRLGVGNALQSSTVNINVANGLDLNAFPAVTLGALGGSGALALGTTALTVGGNNATTTYSGSMTGTTGSLTKLGTGTLTLSAANTYTGGTQISAGAIQIRNAASLGTGPINVANSGQLQFGPSLTVYNNVTLNGNGGASYGGNLVGAMDGGGITGNLWGMLTLNGTSNLSTYWSDKWLLLYGRILGLGGLNIVRYASGNNPSNVALLNSSNSFQGPIAVQDGSLLRAATDGCLGNASNSITLTNSSILMNYATTNGADLVLNPSRNITLTSGGILQAGWTHSLAVNGNISGTGGLQIANDSGWVFLNGANTFSGNLQINNAGRLVVGGTVTANIVNNSSNAGYAGANGSLGSLVFNSAANTTYSGVISGGNPMAKMGAGTLTLNGAAVNTYTGITYLNGGTLKLDFANLATPTNLISSSSALNLNGGSLYVLGKPAATTSQTFASTTLNVGESTFTADGSSTTLNLGAITRNVGGTANFIMLNGGKITTTTANTGTTILGGWATVAATDWAVATGASPYTIAALGAYTNDTWAAGNDTTVTTSSAPPSGSTTNSLRFNTAAANTITLSGINTITTGGLLVTANVGANDSTITGGTLRGASGKDLVIFQYNPSGKLTLGSAIADNTSATGLTLSGGGAVYLTAANTYTGPTHVNNGLLDLGSLSTIGAVASDATVANNAGPLGSNATLNISGGSLNSRTLTVGNYGTGTMNISGAATTVTGNTTGSFGAILAGLYGQGTITQTAGTVSAGTASSSGGNYIMLGRFYNASGTYNLSAGTLQTLGTAGDRNLYMAWDHPTAQGTLSLSGTGAVVLNGGSIMASNSGTATINIQDSATLTTIGGDSNGGFQLGRSGSAVATVNQTGGAVTVNNNYVRIGSWDASTGVYNISAGTLTTQGTGDRNIYLGWDSALATGTLNVSGTGAVSINGGPGHLWIANNGVGKVNLSGNASVTLNNGSVFMSEGTTGRATLTIADNATLTTYDGDGDGGFVIGRNTGGAPVEYATVTQTGGTVSIVRNHVILGRRGTNGTYNISGGLLQTGGASGNRRLHLSWDSAASQSTFNLSGTGQVAINGNGLLAADSGTATMSVADSGILTILSSNDGDGAIDWGRSGTATLTQTGGTITARDGFMRIGRNTPSIGTMNLSGGAFSVTGNNNVTYLGWDQVSSKGYLNISGTAAVDLNGNVNLGGNGNGFVTVSGGNTLIRGNIQVGQNTGSSGTLTVAGGNVTATGSVVMALNAGSTGTVNLTGGTLTVRGLTPGAGTGTFNIGTGGTLAAGTNFRSALPITLNSGLGTVDTGGYTVMLDGALAGTGTLVTKSSTGMLILDGASPSFTGGTRLDAGTLSVQSSTALGSSKITMNGGVMNFGKAGLYEGRLSAAFDTTTLNPATSIMPVTRYGNAYPPGGWADNTTFAYTGYIVNPTSAPVTWTFAENIDDNAMLKIDGNTILNNTSWNTPTSANYTLTPGYHTIDIRMGNGGGGFGYSAQSWMNLGMGIAYDPQGRNAAVGSYYLPLLDPGNGSLLVTNAPVTLANDVALNAQGLFDVYDGPHTLSGKISGLAGLTLTGNGTLALTNAGNSYGGPTIISSGALRATSGAGLPSGSVLALDGGVLEGIGATTFTRSLGSSGTDAFYLTANGGGFSASGGKMTVNLGGGTVVWGSTVGTNLVGTLRFGSNSADNLTDFQNPIDLNGADRTVYVADNPYSAGDSAQLSGVIGNGNGGKTAGLVLLGSSPSATLALTAANTYNGATTVSSGTLALSGSGSILNSSAIILNRGGMLKLDNSATNLNNRVGDGTPITASGGTLAFVGNGTSETVGTIAPALGDSTIALSGAGSANLTGVLGARAAGATLNLTGLDATHTLTLTGQSAGFINQGTFVSGSAELAWYDTGTNTVRAVNYGVDPNTSPVNTVAADTHVKATATPANQNTISLRSLNLSGSGVNFTMNGGQTLTLSTGGLIKAGGGTASTIGGGTGLTVGGGGELVIRTEQAADLLNISMPILGTTGAVTLSGPGTVAVNSQNAQTGLTTANAGVLRLGVGYNWTTDAGPLGTIGTGTVIRPGAVLDVNNQDAWFEPITVSGTGPDAFTGVIANLNTGTGYVRNLTLAGDTTVGSNTGTLSIPYLSTVNGGTNKLIKTGYGVLQFNPETVTLGGLVVNAGVVSLRRSNNLGSSPGITTTVNPGGAVELFGDWTTSVTQSSPLVLAGGGLYGNTGWHHWNGPVTVAADSGIQANDRLYIGGALSGSGKLAKGGGSWLMLGGDTSAYTGTLSVYQGWVFAGAGGTTGTLPADVANYSGVAFDRSNAYAYSGTIVGAGAVSKYNTGTLTFNGSSPQLYTGATTVYGGTLQLDFANMGNPTNLINNTALVLQGGTLSVLGKATNLVTNQSFNGLTINAGANAFVANSNGGVTTNVAVQGIGRNIGGTVDFTLPAAGNIVTTTGNTNGILGGWATVGGSSWATAGGLGPNWYILPLAPAGYTNDTWAAANNTTVAASTAPPSGSTTNSLRFNNAGAYTVTLAGANTITSGGILVTPNVGANTSTITGAGTLTTGAAGLTIIQNNPAGALTIDSPITGAIPLTVSGVGTVNLTSSANNFTGAATINGGTVNLGAAGVINSTSAITVGTTPGQIATLTLGGGSISTTNNVYVGNGGPGVLTQTGGTITLTNTPNGFRMGENQWSQGTYTNTNGTLTVTGTSGDRSAYVGILGQGTMNLNGATVNIPVGTFQIGYQGTGTVNQTDGTVTVGTAGGAGNCVFIGRQYNAVGTYNISGPTAVLQTVGTSGDRNLYMAWDHGSTQAALNVSNGATVTLNGGTLMVGNYGRATVTIDGAASSITTYGGDGNGGLQIGRNGFSDGKAIQTGGTVTINDNYIRIGSWDYATGLYDISAGTLKTAGTAGNRNLYLGWDSWAAKGTLNVSGTGQVLIAGNEFNVAGSGTATVNQSGGLISLFNGGTTTIGRQAPSVGTYNMTGGTLNTTTLNIAQDTARSHGTLNISSTAQINIGGGEFNIGTNGFGTVNQTGGTIINTNGDIIIGRNATAVGTYNISAGILKTVGTAGNRRLYIGWDQFGTTGILNITGTGQVIVNETNLGGGNCGFLASENGTSIITIADSGKLTVYGGSEGEGAMSLGRHNNAVATVNQTGGEVNLYDNYLILGRWENSQGTYNMSGGTLKTLGTNTNGWNNHRLHLAWDSANSKGTMNLSGTAQVFTNVDGVSGYNGFQIAEQGTGLLTVADSALLDINGLGDTDGGLVVGRNGNSKGTVTQTGGTVNVRNNYLILGRWASSTGTYNLTGGVLNVTGTAGDRNTYLGWDSANAKGYFNVGGTGTANLFSNLNVGGNGTGVVTMTGGAINVPATTQLAQNAGSFGTLNLNGGVLTTSALTKGAGTATVNFDGGTLKAGASFSTVLPMNVKAGGATFDTNGKTLGLNGSLSGPGSVTQTGPGTLLLGATNTFGGGLTVNGGTVKLMPVLGGSALWLDATDAAHVIISGGLVTQWQDRLGRPDQVAQTDPNRQPTYVASGINGMPSVRFSAAGTADQLFNTINYASPVSVFSVSRLTGGANQRLITATTNNWLLGYWGGFIDRAWFNDGWVSGPNTPADTIPHMYEAVIRGAGGNSDVYVYDTRNPNMVLLASNQASVNGPNGLSLGYWPPNPGEASNGDVAEILIFRSVLGGAQQQYVENYLLNKWFGTSLPLPAFNFIPDTAAVNLTAATSVLDLNNVTETIGSLAGIAGSQVLLGTASLTTGGNGNTTVFSGVISGSGGLNQAGGKMTLDGANTYTGPTHIMAGTLGLGPSGSIALSPTIIVDQSSFFDVAAVTGGYHLFSGQTLMGNGTVIGSMTTDAGSLITANAIDSTGTFTITGDYTQNGTMLTDIMGPNQGLPTNGYDLIHIKATATLGGTVDVDLAGFMPTIAHYFDILIADAGITNDDLSAVTFDFGDAQTGYQWWAYIVSLGGTAEALRLEVSPEPGTMVLLGAGLLALLRRRRRV